MVVVLVLVLLMLMLMLVDSLNFGSSVEIYLKRSK